MIHKLHKLHKLLCAFAPMVLLAASALAEPLPSPLRVTSTSPDGVATLQLDMDRYKSMQALDRAELSNFALGPVLSVNLSLTRFEVLEPNATIIGAQGVPNPTRPDVQLWRGSVDGAPGSYVYLALTPHGTSGYIQSGNATYIISSGEQGLQPTVIYDLASPAGAGINFDIPACAGAILPPGEQLPPPQGEVSPYTSRTYTCRRFSIAIDCDTEFTTSRFAGNHTNSQAYATSLLGAVSEIYNREANITLQVAYLRTWGANDPYSAPTTGDALLELSGYWQMNMSGTTRSLAHLLSARSLGGGIAYLRAACSTANGYGVSANLNGFFPYPLQDHRSQNWDVVVLAHELGHNLGTGHTHDPGSYTPIIDGCGSSPQDCSNAFQGTIMSYCHTCSGGMTNISLIFGPRVVTAIRTYLDLGATLCGTYTPSTTAITQQPLATTVNENQPVTLSVVTTGQAPVGYLWKRNSGVLSDDGRIQGSTTANLTINPARFEDIASYSVVVMSACGPLNSQPAWLTVVTCPTIATQPQAATVALGQPATLTVNAGGTLPRTYQWRRNAQPLSNTGPIAGATTNTLQFSAVTAGDAGDYDVVVTNPCGQTISNPASLTITGSPCGSSDFNGDGDYGTDADIEAFFACLGGTCCPTCFAAGSDFNSDGDYGTDADIESFFRVLGGGNC